MYTVLITTSILFLSAIVFICLESRYPYQKGYKIFRDGFWVDLVWYTIIQSYFLKILIFDYIIVPVDNYFQLSSFHLVSNWPLFYQVAFFFISHDFYIYWFHRLQHSSKILWKTHEAHHSNKQVDWLAGSRSHVFEILINQTIEFAPIIFLGADPAVVPIKAMIDAVYGMYIHSNISTKHGRWIYIFNGPEMHQWHHGNHSEVYFANFSTKLSLWDWIFGTAYLPEHKPGAYGLSYYFPRDYFVQQIYAIKQLDENRLMNFKIFRYYYQIRQKLIQFYNSKCKSISYKMKMISTSNVDLRRFNFSSNDVKNNDSEKENSQHSNQ